MDIVGILPAVYKKGKQWKKPGSKCDFNKLKSFSPQKKK